MLQTKCCCVCRKLSLELQCSALNGILTAPFAVQNHASVTEYPKVRGMVHDVFFWNHNHPEGGKDETASKQNNVEAAMAARLAFYLTQQGYKDVAIITPYVGQLALIRAEVGKYMQFVVSDRDREELAGLQVHTLPQLHHAIACTGLRVLWALCALDTLLVDRDLALLWVWLISDLLAV